MKRSVRFPVPPRWSACSTATRSRHLLRRLALASIVANVGIVVTGGAVRLTALGPGLPDLAPVHRRVVRHHGRRWACTA